MSFAHLGCKSAATILAKHLVKQKAAGLVLALLLGGCERATSGARIPTYEHPQVALLVLDLQKDFLEPSGRLPVQSDEVEPMLGGVNRLIDGAKALGVDVVYVRNAFAASDWIGNWLRNRAAIEDEPGSNFDPRLHLVNAPSLLKRRGDAFSNAELDRLLRSRMIDHVVLAGVFADACVRLTALGAMNRGYKVQVLSDAVAARSDARRERALETLRRAGVEISDSERALAEWTRRKRYLASR